MHAPEDIEEALQIAGFRMTGRHEPLATAEDMKFAGHMWGDEKELPYHIAITAQRIT